jgi:hypothetical protein
MITLVPGGASGGRLKPNAPFMCASAESCGLMRDHRRRFKVSRHCGNILSQRLRGKSRLVEHKPASNEVIFKSAI